MFEIQKTKSVFNNYLYSIKASFDYIFFVICISCREKDIEEVLQTETVFTNVSRGEVAKAADLKKAFSSDDHKKICLEVC